MGLEVERLELGPFGTNMYVVRASPEARDAVVIDPSGDLGTIQRVLSDLGARCATILVTHSHVDHIIGLADLAEETHAPVYAPAGERLLFEQPMGAALLGIDVRPSTPDVWLQGGETVDGAGTTFAVTSVPGHSPAHLAYFAAGHLFSGDVLFADSVGRTDLPGGDWSVLQASIASLLDAYPLETIVHPGHGPETTLGGELQRNPFLAELRAARRRA